MDVLIVLPALNEEKTIAKTIEDIPLSLLGDSKILVVDNGSTDNTHDIALNHGCIVVSGLTRGKGNAIKEAQSYIKANIKTDYIVMLDSDFTYPGKYIPDIVKFLGRYDIVLGSRLDGIEEGAMSGLNIFGNKCLTLISRVLYGVKISDLCTGMWGFRSSCFSLIKIAEPGFGLEANLLAECAKRKFRIAEIPITYRKRPTPPKLKSLKDGFKIGLALIKQRCN